MLTPLQSWSAKLTGFKWELRERTNRNEVYAMGTELGSPLELQLH